MIGAAQYFIEVMEMFSVTVQYNSHWPHVVKENWKLATPTEELDFNFS